MRRFRACAARRGVVLWCAACALALTLRAAFYGSVFSESLPPVAPCPIAACNLTAYCVARGGAGIALAYNNAGMQDGAGSQLHRVVLTLALARAVSAGYVHAALLSLDLHGDPPTVLGDWNSLMHLPDAGSMGCAAEGDRGWLSLSSPRDGCAHARMGHKIVWDDVLRVTAHECSRTTTTWPWIRAGSPRVLVHLGAAELFDAAPELFSRVAARFSDEYAWLRALRPGDAPVPGAACGGRATLSVAMHVRRGDVVATHRTIPNEYFVGMARALVAAARAAALPDLRFTFYMDAVEAGSEAAALRLDDFSRIEDAELVYGGSALDTFRALSRADVLVMSRSSFSFLPALLHDENRGAVVYHPMWHAPRADWFVAQEWSPENGMGAATPARLAAYLKARRDALCST